MNAKKTFFESAGLVLRKIANILWFFLPIILIVLLICIYIPDEEPQFPEIEIERDNLHIENYLEYSNKTTCSLEITFNQRVYEGPVTVAFYDINNRQLETVIISMETASYSSYDTNMVNSYFDVSGKVASCKIIDYSKLQSAEPDIYNPYDGLTGFTVMIVLWSFFRCIYIIPIVLSSLFFNCKSYLINGHKVVVYAGRLHHYIKIDGRKFDEKNTFISFSAIKLSASLDENAKIEVYIPSFTKRITLRVNGILEQPSSF